MGGEDAAPYVSFERACISSQKKGIKTTYIYEFYRGLLGTSEHDATVFRASAWTQEGRVSYQNNAALLAPFSLEEITKNLTCARTLATS
jgi:hypothetical protein